MTMVPAKWTIASARGERCAESSAALTRTHPGIRRASLSRRENDRDQSSPAHLEPIGQPCAATQEVSGPELRNDATGCITNLGAGCTQPRRGAPWRTSQRRILRYVATIRAAVAWKRRRKSLIAVLLRVGCTRLDNKTQTSGPPRAAGSIHTLVPV